jgi:pimeloyl-ACP methyl ester carboxylesterase
MLVGHDFGAMVAYACARRHADEVGSLVLLDQAIPGIPGWDTTASAYPFWHLGFHRDVQDGVGVAETLVSGNEAFYFRNHFNRFAAHPEAVTADDLDTYLSAYTPKSRLEAGFGMFRALSVDAGHNERDTGTLHVPVLLAFGEYSQASFLDTVAEGLRDVGVATVTTTSVRDCGHWMAEEQPAAVGALLLEAASG